MNKAVLLGTSHSVQRGETRKKHFHSFLTSLCHKEKIKSIAEEINDNAELIIAKLVCDELGINHLIIEPNPSDYKMLEIAPYERIQYEVMCAYGLDEAPSANNSPDEALTEFESRIALEHSLPREREWLKRILNNDVWPVLVICGVNHFQSFYSLLAQNSIQVIRSESNWSG